MTKLEFLELLKNRLSRLDGVCADERVEFYSEMIDDRIEEGLSEKEAVLAMGDIEGIVAQTIAQTPLTKIIREKIKPKRSRSTREIVLLTLGSPILLSLFAVLFSVIVSVWAVAVSIASLPVGLAACGAALPLGGVVFLCLGHVASGLALIASGLVCLGLFIFAAILTKAVFKYTVAITKGVMVGLKKALVKKGEEK